MSKWVSLIGNIQVAPIRSRFDSGVITVISIEYFENVEK